MFSLLKVGVGKCGAGFKEVRADKHPVPFPFQAVGYPVRDRSYEAAPRNV